MSNTRGDKTNSLNARTRVLPTDIQGISVKTIINKSGTKITGYLVESDTFAPIGNIENERKSRKISNAAETDFKRRELVAALTKQYKTKNSSTPLSAEIGLFSKKYQALDDDSRKVLFAGWSDSTARSVQTFMERQILPELDLFNAACITEADLIQIKSKLLKHAEANQRSRKDEDTMFNLDDRLYRVNIVLQRLHISHPDLPLIQFPLEQGRRRTYREQIKALPDEVRHKFFLILIEMAKSGIQLVLAVALMLFAGLRTGEAAAARFEDISIISGRFATYYVNKRLDTSGKIETILKSENAYRVVVLPFAFVILYKILLKSFSLIGKEQPSGYILCNEQLDLSLFSARIKQLLIDSGLSKDTISAIVDLMLREPDAVDGERITDPTAYILRRDWATRAVNWCGLSYRDLDYYLGHANDSINRKDYLDEILQSRIARQLEQYVFDPEYSLHPGFCPVRIIDTNIISIEATNRCLVHKSNERKQLVKLELLTQEPGDIFRIVLPRPPKKSRVSTVLENTESRSYRPILGRYGQTEKDEVMLNENPKVPDCAGVE